MVTPVVRPEAVAHLVEHHGMSERRSCRVTGVDRSTIRYGAGRCGAAKEAAGAGRGSAALRLPAPPRAAEKGRGRVEPQARAEDLRQGESSTCAGAADASGRSARERGWAVPERPNARWSLDFVHDQVTDGRRFRVLVVVDECTRECLALVPDTSISGVRVTRELDRVIGRRGRPGAIVSGNGTELTSNAVLSWSDERGIAWEYIQPAKPAQNAFAESFMGGYGTSSSTRRSSARSPVPAKSSGVACQFQRRPAAFAARLAHSQRVCPPLPRRT